MSEEQERLREQEKPGTLLLSASRLLPVHPAWDVQKVSEIKARLLQDGWDGLPLLAEVDRGAYVAWTGSHRIAALKQLEAEGCSLLAPVVLVDTALLLASGVAAPSSSDHALNWGTDAMRMARLRVAGDQPAYDIMREEVKMNPESLYEYLESDDGKLSEFFRSREEREAYLRSFPEAVLWLEGFSGWPV